MVFISLKIKANLENVESLKPSSSKEFRWYLKFACNNCQTESNTWHYVSQDEEISTQGGGNAVCHFVEKCKFCSRDNSLAIIPESINGITADSCTEFKSIVVFDCRGLDPKEFSAREGWTVKAADNGKTFEDVDLSEGEWADYCDKTNQPVGVYDIEHRFDLVKKVKCKTTESKYTYS